MEPALVCVTKTQEQAQQIVDRLREAGFSTKDTSILLSASKEMLKIEGQQEARREKSGAVGSGMGAIAGGLTGLLLALTIFDVPEVGALIALGPIVVHVADAVAAASGSAIGAIAGALAGIRVPDHSAKFYEKAVQEEMFSYRCMLTTPHDERLRKNGQWQSSEALHPNPRRPGNTKSHR